MQDFLLRVQKGTEYNFPALSKDKSSTEWMTDLQLQVEGKRASVFSIKFLSSSGSGFYNFLSLCTSLYATRLV